METSVPIIDYNTCAQWFHIEQAQRPKPSAKSYIDQEGSNVTQSILKSSTWIQPVKDILQRTGKKSALRY